MKYPSYRHIPAFSLLELLVVIGIIALLAAVGATMFGGSAARGTSVQSAVESGIGMVELARRSALSSQRKARLVINNDPQSEGNLRQLAVAVAQDAAANSWRLVSRPRTLPGTSFLFSELSTGFTAATFDFRNGEFGAGDEALIWEFDGVGNFIPGSDGAASANVIFAAGVPSASAPFTPDFPAALSQNRDGFIIRRSGAVVRFEDLSHIQP